MSLINSNISPQLMRQHGWDYDDDRGTIFPFYKVVTYDGSGVPEVSLVITNINNKFELCIHHDPTGVLIHLRSPESFEELATIESMIIGADEI